LRSALPPDGAASTRGVTAAAADAPNGVAQFEQNLAPAAAGVPQLGHVTANGDAHSWQNLAPTLFCVPQLEQITVREVYPRPSPRQLSSPWASA
jgi:hypothetical protein